MNRLIYGILTLAAATLLTACTKDLDIDYNEIDPIYVIEGQITDSPARVLLTKTRNMNDSVHSKGIDAGRMVLSDDLGRYETLVFGDDGYYHSPSGWCGEDGRTYTLTATIDGKEYKSSSTMRPKVTLDSISLFWATSSGMKMLLMKYMFTYPKSDEPSYTYFFVTKNGNFYRSNPTKQINLDVRQSSAMVGCTTEKVMEENEPEKQDVILHEGDKLHCELWTIDRGVYDYFFSIKTSQQNASNPISDFAPSGVLGYFSAHHTSSIDFTFSVKDIHE